MALRLDEISPCFYEFSAPSGSPICKYGNELMLRAITGKGSLTEVGLGEAKMASEAEYERILAESKKMKCCSCGEEIKPGERYEYYDDGYATMPVHSFHGYNETKIFTA